MKKIGIEIEKTSFYYSPVLIMFFLCVTVFIVEMLVMLFFPFIAPFPKWMNAFVDSFLLTVFIFPAFYYLISRQTKFHINKLVNANAGLQTEVAERKKAEETLRMYEHIVSSSSEHMSFVDRNYIYRAVNNTYLDAHQKRREEIVGHSVAELFSEEVFQGLVKERLDLCLNGRTVKYQSWFDFPGKGRSYVDVVYYPFRTAEGPVEGVVVVARDITEYEQADEALRNSEGRLRALYNALPDIAFILDEHGRYMEILAQPQKESLLYADMNALKGRLLHDVLPKESADLFLSVVRSTMETQENQIIEYLFAVQAGERWFEGRTAPLNIAGKDKMVVWVSRDITARKKAEDNVRRSEASLAQAQRIAQLGNWDWDILKNTAYCSVEMDLLYGFEPGGFGRTVEALMATVHPDDRKSVETAMREALAGVKPFSIDRRVVLPDGKVRIVHEDGEVTRDETGRPIRMSGTTQDITERKRAEEKLRFQSEIMANMSEAVYLVKTEGSVIVYANTVCEEMFGYEHDEMIGKHASVVNAPAQKKPEESANEIMQSINEKGFWRGEVNNIKKDGTHFWSHATVSVFNHSTFGRVFLSIHMDITERKYAEEALHKYADALEAKVRERTAELEEKTIQAESASRAKTEFLSNMSHELRTPLNAIIGFTELLKNGVAGALTGEQNDYLKSVWESGKHLHRIINDILAMTEIELDGVALEPGDVPLKETIEEILGRFSGKAERQGIRISADIPDDIGHITADGKKIRQVIQHLLGNAFKFTTEGGSVRVAARRVRNSDAPPFSPPLARGDMGGDFIEISIADTGIGIAKEDLGRLFHPFQQLLPALTKRYEGVGVGLSICRKYIELHGGTIWVESEVGKGSRFIFIIPV